MVEDEVGGSGDPGARFELCGGDLKVAGGQGQRSLVDEFTYSGDEVVSCGGEYAADDDDGGVEQAGRVGDSFTESASGGSDAGQGGAFPLFDMSDDVAGVV